MKKLQLKALVGRQIKIINRLKNRNKELRESIDRIVDDAVKVEQEDWIVRNNGMREEISRLNTYIIQANDIIKKLRTPKAVRLRSVA